jgi:uncharacterized protein
MNSSISGRITQVWDAQVTDAPQGLPLSGVRKSQPEDDRLVPLYAVENHGQICFLFSLYNLSMTRKLSLEKILETLRGQVPMLAERYSVEKLEVFGSYVRSEQNKNSDLDLLVTFKEVPSLLTFIAMENYLSDLLGVKVDLVMKDSLKPKIGQRILQEAISV